MFMNHDIKFQGCAPIEWPTAVVEVFNTDGLNSCLPRFMTYEMVEITYTDGTPTIFSGIIFNYEKLKFLFHVHKLIELYVVTIHLLNDGDEVLLTDRRICRVARRFRALVLSPISSEKVIQACDLLITAKVHEA
jgi:hypothetical protein